MSIIEVPVTEKYKVTLNDNIIAVDLKGHSLHRFKADVPIRVINDCNLPQLVLDEVLRLAQEYMANRPLSVDARAYTTRCTWLGQGHDGVFTFNVSGPDADALRDVFKREGSNGVVRLRVDTVVQ